MQGLRIAPLAPAHRSRVAELLVATAAFSADEVDVALSLVPSDARAESGNRHSQPDYECVGAFDGDHLLGYACFGPTPSTDGTYDLYWLAVDPAAQGRGFGRALVRAVEEKLIARGGRLLVVETSSRTDYAPTRKFYERAGYAEAARVRDFYAPADDRIILTTRLTQTPGGVATS